MKTIKNYIQFAIDNGYKLIYPTKLKIIEVEIEDSSVRFIYNNWNNVYQNTIETITSKPFIEAITKWMAKKYSIPVYEEQFDYITTQQAIAIRDNKLKEFITQILWKQ